jgi:hypothetical protein
VIGDENAGCALSPIRKWIEQRMPERRRCTQTTSLEQSLGKEATQLHKQAQWFAKSAEPRQASHTTRWPASGYRHQDKFTQMAIYRLLKNSTLPPEEISRLRGIRASVAHPLRQDRDDPLKTIAKQIIKIAQAGVHDAAQLSALAIAEPHIR